MIFIFIILGLLYFMEMSTSLMRQVGYAIERPDAGLQLQSSFSMLASFLMLLMLPTVGYYADNNTIDFGLYSIYLIIPLIIVFLLSSKKTFFLDIYYSLMMSMLKEGSFFKVKYFKFKGPQITRKSTYFKLLIVGAYFPYYISWPLCMLLIDYFPENRAMLLGTTGVVNGINTVILALYIDPYLIKIGRYTRLTRLIYTNIFNAKFTSLFLATALMFFVINVLALFS